MVYYVRLSSLLLLLVTSCEILSAPGVDVLHHRKVWCTFEGMYSHTASVYILWNGEEHHVLVSCI